MGEMAMARGELSVVASLQIDDEYEFSAPRFFDFSALETEEEIRKAELWFENGKSDAPSPFMMKIKAGRFADSDAPLCDFDTAKDHMDFECKEVSTQPPSMRIADDCSTEKAPAGDAAGGRLVVDNLSSAKISKKADRPVNSACKTSRVPACTPRVLRSSSKGTVANSVKSTTRAAKSKNASSSMKLKTSSVPMRSGFAKPQGMMASAQATAVSEIAQENQAIKRQKLDGGRIRQIHNVKSRFLLHKSKPDLARSIDSVASASKYLHEEAGTYVSVAEMVKKFESKTRELEFRSSHNQEDTLSAIQKRHRLVLTRPKEPEFQTAHRVRAMKVKSSDELEAEMLAKIPKFKARPVNKKILEAPSLPPLPKRVPQAPEFQEFNLRTMERSERTTSVLSSSNESSSLQSQDKVPKLTEVKPPLLETSLRARPSRMKTTEELELEELEKAPKFKARPLNKKILESKGEIGLSCKPKCHLTIPQDFHFATTERLGPPQTMVVDLFDKLSIHSSEHNEHKSSRITIPNPFNLQTEERGMEKEKRFTEQLVQKQIEEEKARIPKANPYPYTTDYPVIPPKPQPKECTKADLFQLESLARHEEEERKMIQMMEKMKEEEAQQRIFRARPILMEDPLPLPEKARKPLTEVQEIVLHVDHRAEERAEFDKKVKAKELMHKRQREENEHAKMVEEEKALKQMRRMMVPHARPVPNFSNPFLPQKSTKEKTTPKSPGLRIAQREERRRHYIR